jgi:hypothetical protein
MAALHPDVERYFEYESAGVEYLEDGLHVLRFGEYLVEKQAISRTQLLTALMAQDNIPGVPLGEVVATLGFCPRAKVACLLDEYQGVPVVEV